MHMRHISPRPRLSVTLLFVFLLSLLAPATAPTQAVERPVQKVPERTSPSQGFSHASPALAFASQIGRHDTEQRFRVLGSQAQISFTPAGVAFVLPVNFPVTPAERERREAQRDRRVALQHLRLRFVGARGGAKITGVDPLPGVLNEIDGSQSES